MAHPQSLTVLEPSDIVIETPSITAAEMAALTAVLTAAAAERAAGAEIEDIPEPNTWQHSLRPASNVFTPGPDAWRRAAGFAR